MMSDNKLTNSKTLIEATKESPCQHCGKTKWCYRIGDLEVCKFQVEPAPGWHKTSKADKDGSFYYAPEQPKKTPRPAGRKDYFYSDRQGNKLVKVTAIRKENGDKDYPASRWDKERRNWVSGLNNEVKAQLPIYKYAEVQEAIKNKQPIFFVEGESAADALIALGLAATTTCGGSKKYRTYGDYKQDLVGADVVLCPDRDEPGMEYMEEVAKDFPTARWLYAPPSDYFWDKLAKRKGLDIVDWIEVGATAENIKAAIGEKIYSSSRPILESDRPGAEVLDFSLPEADEIFTQKATAALFGDTRWISLNGHLHRWNGTHYELVADAVIKAKIARWCASTAVQNGERWKYAYAKSSYVENIWNWVALEFAIDPAVINPPGINCLNGTVKLQWEGKKVTWRLESHNQDDYYTYTSQIQYDPKADSTECDRLLACLDVEQRDIFLKTLASSLDLATVRRYRGREVKALLCQGYGSNGKDSLREAASYLYGTGMTSATVSDFASYDQARKFTLAKLEGSIINWSSENSSFKNIDNLQSLKAAITGDPLDVERKNQDERPMTLNTVFLFNINEAPILQAGLEAIQTRWAVLSFRKTYKIGADESKGELEADGRFRYDPHFLQTQVVPALLNKILDVLPKLMIEGINYKCTQKALEDIQQQTNHLWAFSNQVGLSYSTGGRVYINELWEKLKDWYVANGTLEIHKTSDGKDKPEWHDPVSNKDKNVRGANQIYQRFSELFPKITKVRDSQSPSKKGQFYLSGIAFSEASEAVSEAVGEATSRSQSGGEAGEAVEYTLLQLLTQIQTLEPLKLREIMLKIKNRSNVGQTASLASLVDIARAVASPTASLTASPASLEDRQVITNAFHSNEADNSRMSDSAIGINQAVVDGSKIGQNDNTSNFFPTAPLCFKVGDRCRVSKKYNGITSDKEFTIIKIDDAIATITPSDSKSRSGAEIELKWLEPLEQEGAE